MISIIGFMKLLFTFVSKVDPAKAATNASAVISNINSQFTDTRRAYCAVAILVPLNDGIFKVPITVAKGYCGNNTSAAGVCINPPPPAIASVNPAKNATKQSSIISMLLPFPSKHAHKLLPRAYGFIILFGHYATELMNMSKIMHHPGSKQLPQCYVPQCRMYTGTFEQFIV